RPQYYSTKPEIATVSSTGVVTGLNLGATTILATITVGGVTGTTSYDVIVTRPVAATVMICGQACTTPVPGTGIAFTPASFTVSATQAQVQGLAGAVVTFTVAANTFTATTTPNNTQCFNVTFANPGAAGAVPPSTNAGDIGTLCSGSQSRLFTTPGTYTYTNTTNGATGTIIVQ
ncbi:MAG: Ig-like domain-containing protein, partial [Gemmatimonadales bacterium]